MQGKGPGSCARKLISEIGTIKSMDVVVPVKRGTTTAELTVRTVARPDTHVAELLLRLGLDLPTRNRSVGPVRLGSLRPPSKCSAENCSLIDVNPYQTLVAFPQLRNLG